MMNWKGCNCVFLCGKIYLFYLKLVPSVLYLRHAMIKIFKLHADRRSLQKWICRYQSPPIFITWESRPNQECHPQGFCWKNRNIKALYYYSKLDPSCDLFVWVFLPITQTKLRSVDYDIAAIKRSVHLYLFKPCTCNILLYFFIPFFTCCFRCSVSS